MRVDVLWTGRELGTADLNGRTVVVIDVLRASTTILTALLAGARRVIVCGSVTDATRTAADLGNGAVLGGERQGVRVAGFDLGNSPLEYEPSAVGDRDVVLSTTNGSPAMNAATGAGLLLAACLRNLDAVVSRIRTEAASVTIVCAGRQGSVSLDDTLCAGLIVQRLAERDAGLDISDGASAAALVATACGQPGPEWLAGTEAGDALVQIGFQADLEFCAALDVETVVPEWRNGAFQLMEVFGRC